MKTSFIIISILMVVFIALLFNYRMTTKEESAPGLVDGMLSKCPDKPNCVCSVHKDDPDHYIDPIAIPSDIALDALTILKKVIQDMGGKIQIEANNYLAVTFTSAIFKFVDDLEISIEPTQRLIHIRSASRVGYNDMGVYRKRAELLKALFNEMTSTAAK